VELPAALQLEYLSDRDGEVEAVVKWSGASSYDLDDLSSLITGQSEQTGIYAFGTEPVDWSVFERNSTLNRDAIELRGARYTERVMPPSTLMFCPVM
jgi:hypothetical protein